MGIYLPNIEIPGNGIITRLLIEIPKAGKPTCEAFYDTEDGEASVKLDIGVIEVPTPHGRLIDADKLFTWFDGDSLAKYPIGDAKQYNTIMYYEVFGEIDDAPTVIEAEEEGQCSNGGL